MTQLTINQLPVDVAQKVRSTLEVYPRCYVFHRGDSWNVSVGIALTSGDDDPCVGEYKNTDLYSDEEIREFNSKLPDFNW